MNESNTTTRAQGARILGGEAAMQACGTSADCKMSPEPTVSVTVEVRAVRGFGDALYAALGGQRITRAGWNASGQYVLRRDPSTSDGLPYLALFNAQAKVVPWVPSQGDLFAHDWAILPA